MCWLRSARSARWDAGINRITGHGLAFTFEGLVLGSVLYSLPFAVQPMATSFASVDRKLLDASALSGASRWRTFWRIVLPLGLPGVLTGFVLSFAHTLGEFGVVLMIGGNIPGATQTISILIYDQVQALELRRRKPHGAVAACCFASRCWRCFTVCADARHGMYGAGDERARPTTCRRTV